MPVINEGLERELMYVTKPFEQNHIRGLWEHAEPLMQEISYNLITRKSDCYTFQLCIRIF